MVITVFCTIVEWKNMHLFSHGFAAVRTANDWKTIKAKGWRQDSGNLIPWGIWRGDPRHIAVS
jgi:hypothetical protein